MALFEEEFRRIGTRGLLLSKRQMQNFRIRKILNSAGDTEYLNDKCAQRMMESAIEKGEFCLLEAVRTEEIYLITLITFEDLWSRNIFALRHWVFYSDFPDLITLYN